MDFYELHFWFSSNLIFTAKFKFEINQKWSSSKSIFQNSSADQQGVCLLRNVTTNSQNSDVAIVQTDHPQGLLCQVTP